MIDCEHCQDKVCKHKDGRWVRFCPGAEADNAAHERRLQDSRSGVRVTTLRRNGRLVPLQTVEDLL